MPGSNGGNGGGYDGDEEPTPASAAIPLSGQARILADVALAFTAVGARLWELARLLDATGDPRRGLLLARTEVELGELTITIADARRVVTEMKGTP
jgi:hypothetical protein